jgi:hypothetical protein
MENPKRPTVALVRENRFPTGISMDNFSRPPFPEQQQPVPAPITGRAAIKARLA